jgi:hypothetical protein
MPTITDLTTGANIASMSGLEGAHFFTIEKNVDLVANPVQADAANILRIANLPAGVLPLGIKVDVTTADSVGAATLDIGLYKDSDDSAIDVDCLANEVAIGAVALAKNAAPAAASGNTVDAWVGIIAGAGSALALNDAVFEVTIWGVC